MKRIKINFDKEIEAKRFEIALLLIDAVNNLTQPDAEFQRMIQKIAEYLEDKTGNYPVITLSRDDIQDIGFNPDGLSPGDMRNFANQMPKESMMESYWDSLRYHIEKDVALPELRTEADRIYKVYKKENGNEPRYAHIWLEDRGFNNLPWQDTVKLTLDIDENEDEEIYMYFQGYSDLKKWLFSTLKEDSNSEDVWCYENPQHRIEFFDKLLLDE